MTAYEQHLLGLLTLRCIDRRYVLTIQVGHVLVTNSNEEPVAWCASSTLAQALPHLLRDLGVEVPETPGPGDLAAIGVEYQLADLPGLFKADPVWVLAWLEGGGS